MLFFSLPGREVAPGLIAPPAHALVPVVALHRAPPDAPAVLLRPTPAPAVALPLAALHPQPPNQRSPANAPLKRASLPPLRRLREPLSPVPALVPAPALVHAPVLALLLLTANAKVGV